MKFPLQNLLNSLEKKSNSSVTGRVRVNEDFLDAYERLLLVESELNLRFSEVIAHYGGQKEDYNLFDNGDHDTSWRKPLEKAEFVTISLSTAGGNGTGGYFHDVNELLSLDFISTNSIPKSLYIKEINYLKTSREESESDFYKRLEQATNFSIALSKQSQHTTNDKDPNYIYISEGGKTNILTIRLTSDLLASPPSSFNLLKELQDIESEDSLKGKDKKLIFYSTLNEFLSSTISPQSQFEKLFMNWGDFKVLYDENYSSYANEFRFDKLKKELAETELTLVSKIVEVSNDCSTKVLAIPASMGALALLNKTDRVTETSSVAIFLIGIVIATVMVLLIIQAQLHKLTSIDESKDLVLSSLKNKHVQVLSISSSELDKVLLRLDKNIDRTKKWLTYYSYLAFAPLLTYIILLSLENEIVTKRVFQYFIEPLY
ncbi:hypothetical protein ACPUEK_10550 [Marinomonas gallaica]|uniref:hypothetical protein n=3 Tax=Marinomonas TaxID=28253 RepID=UPI003CE58128